jgi:serine protease AprX
MTAFVHGRLRLPEINLRILVGALVLAAGVLAAVVRTGNSATTSSASAASRGSARPAPAGTAAHGNVAAPLAHLVVTRPGQRVEVIIQLRPGVSLGRGRALVRAAGGRPGLDLHIINGLSARMSAAAAGRLGAESQVRAVSLNAALKTSDYSTSGPVMWRLAATFDRSVGANRLWPRTTGAGVGVAVIDTGISGALPDFRTSQSDTTSRVIDSVVMDPNATTANDTYGHGTVVAGLIAGNGSYRDAGDPQRGQYDGTAPDAHLISIKVADDSGQATTLDAIYGLQFAVDHRAQDNIRVVNMSFRSTSEESSTTDPLDAAAEQAWFAGITVVAAAGNMGDAPDAVSYAPGNDPYVLTVGAVDEQGTRWTSDDVLASWSSQGTSQDGIAKPDVLAPGAHIVSTLSPDSQFATLCPTCVIANSYFQVSGTSLAAPIVAGIAADLAAAHPDWTPAMIKGAIVNTATSLPSGGHEVNAVAAYWAGGSDLSSDQNLTPNTLIDPDSGTIDYTQPSWSAGSWSTATDPLAASWSAASWSSVGCSSGSGGEVSPTSASWSTVGWTTMWG